MEIAMLETNNGWAVPPYRTIDSFFSWRTPEAMKISNEGIESHNRLYGAIDSRQLCGVATAPPREAPQSINYFIAVFMN